MDDNLFKEIQDDLERQRLGALWAKYGSFVIGLALVIILGTAGYVSWQSFSTGKSARASSDLLAILSEADQVKRLNALQDFATSHHGIAQSAMAALHAGAAAVKNGDTKKAVQIYDALAADTKSENAFRQMATLFSVKAQMDEGDAKSLITKLQPLMAEKAPWRYTAMEYAGHLAMKAGDVAGAKKFFDELAKDDKTPKNIRHRAQAMTYSLAVR